jgi:2-iminobutanoate/2-iminopropanoate deaminase
MLSTMTPMFHIAEASGWADAQANGLYRRSTLGRTVEDEGFIHCSYLDQVEAVANTFYAGRKDLLLLVIDPAKVASEIREEAVDGRERFRRPEQRCGGLGLTDSVGVVPTAAQEGEMSRETVMTNAAPKSVWYSQAVKAAGLVFVSGQAGYDPATGELVGTTIQEQTRQCLKNLAAILEAAGSSIDKIVNATFILADPEDFVGMNEEWQVWFPVDPPARQGAKLPVEVPGLRVSIAVTAEA